MIVDDEIINQEILKEILSKDYEVLLAGNGIEALHVIETSVAPISLILLDLNMPLMDGLTLIREIKKDEKNKNIPIIVLTSDEVFSNFRSLRSGNLKDNYLYRSASPCDNQHNRASHVDQLIEANGVRHIVNLADNDDKIKGYMAKDDFNSEYFETLFNKDDLDNDHVDALALNMNFESDYFKGQVINALIAIKNNEGPILIHCTEGKDRTGFVCMLIEALAGASFLEIEEDYMMTYFNYYAITKAFEEVKYNTIVDNVLVPMIESLGGGEAIDVKNTDLAILAKNYLLRNGMSENDINGLLEVICQNK